VGDVLSYYEDPTKLYFPTGQIDLRYGISASTSDKDKEGLSFTIVTRIRTYNLRADSAPSAKEWVRSLQRVIFRNHNDGDSVKISIPIENVMDVEETQMMQFAETCKIKVIDNDDTFAIDEVRNYRISSADCASNVSSVLFLIFQLWTRGFKCSQDYVGRSDFGRKDNWCCADGSRVKGFKPKLATVVSESYGWHPPG
jgi:sterol 3beta-glucosyltransferase